MPPFHHPNLRDHAEPSFAVSDTGVTLSETQLHRDDSRPAHFVAAPAGISFRDPEALSPSAGVLPRSLDAFPQDYFQSRSRFLDLLRLAGGRSESHEIAARGPQGQPLHIDIGIFGPENPKRVLLHIAGMHGIEGFVGSAIQSEVLRAKPLVGGDAGFVLVHCLNPWGMAHLRRANEDNIDLNRNFLPAGGQWEGTPEGYRLLNGILNPSRREELSAWFYPSAIGSILRHGFTPLKQAVLDGQFDQPAGIMFGGHGRAESSRFIDAWLRRTLGSVERVLGIDVHAGLGSFARQTLFIEHRRSNPRVAEIERALEMRLTTLPEGAGPYVPTARGAACDALPALFPDARVDWLLQEFGTYSALRVLRALREENFFYHHGTAQERQSYATHFREMFTPQSFQWRESVLRTGVNLVARAAQNLLA